MKISYLGTNYVGFQKQKSGNTIQGVLESTFSNIFGKDISIFGCSRTDSGVHALEYYCNFNIYNFSVPLCGIRDAMNSKLPYDIRVFECYEEDEKFHSRYCASKKHYEYKIFNDLVLPPSKYVDHMHFKHSLNFGEMQRASKYFEGEHDFKAFMSQNSSVKSTIRKIFNSDLRKEENVIIYDVVGDGFLYNMVRIIVGTLIMVGQGRINSEDIPFIIESSNRGLSGFVSEAKGLTLKKVFYDN